MVERLGVGKQKLRVLIVEDQIALAENLFEFLGEEKYQLDFAADGLTGLHLAVTNTYDVVVLDVMLPGMNGFEICRRLRKDMCSSLPIILLTAKDSLEDKEIGFGEGADDYLTKPFNMRELELRIQALGRRRQATSSELRVADICYSPGTLKVSSDNGSSLALVGIGASLFEILIRTYPNYASHTTLIEAVWGDEDVDPHTLRSHISALRRSLKAHFGRSMIQSLRGKGYVFDACSESV